MKIALISISISALMGFFGIFSWFTDKIDKKADKVEVRNITEKVDTKADKEEIKEEIKEVEGKTEVNKEEIVERRIIDKEQSVYIEQMQQNQLKFIEEFKELQQAK